MTWGHPQLLWLLAALALVACARIFLSRAIRRRQASIGVGVALLTGGVGRRRQTLRAGLLWGGLALIVTALAQPRWGAVDITRTATGADVLLVLDCSRSMLAKDLYPTRIEAARRKALDLVRLAPETRLALMPFAAIPVLRCPLTGDHAAIEQMLEDCSPDLFPAEEGFQGTAIGEAVSQGLRVLERQADRGQAILIMSDGSDDDHDAVDKAASAAKSAGVPVFGLFMGDPEKGATIEVDGKAQSVVADRSTLDHLAERTGGVCVNATADDADVRALRERMTSIVAQRPWQERRRIVATERYHWLILPGFAGIFLGAVMPTRRRERPAAVTTLRLAS